jgi:hypothetical protein
LEVFITLVETKCSVLFAPALELYRTLRRRILGEKFWNYQEAKRVNQLLGTPSTIGMIGIRWIICYLFIYFGVNIVLSLTSLFHFLSPIVSIAEARALHEKFETKAV